MFRSESRCQGPVDEGGISKGFYYTCFFAFLLRMSGSTTESRLPEGAAMTPNNGSEALRRSAHGSLEKFAACADSRYQPQKM